jgi:hypothetical protein
MKGLRQGLATRGEICREPGEPQPDARYFGGWDPAQTMLMQRTFWETAQQSLSCAHLS